MENEDLGSKKINNEQQINEGFSGENIPVDYDPANAKLNQELETDKDGNNHIVDRVRSTGGVNESERSWDENQSLSRGVNENELARKVENKDRNDDSDTHRYPNSHPDNHQNRGNIEMDDD